MGLRPISVRALMSDPCAATVCLRDQFANGSDRSNFFIHGGKKPGSAGCIDAGDCDTFVCNRLRQEPDDAVNMSFHYSGAVCN